MNFDCTKLMIWQGVNRNLLILHRVNQNFHKLQVCHKCLKPNKFQITRRNHDFTGEKIRNDLGIKHC